MSRRFTDLELNITYGCNLACQWCERLLDIQPLQDADVTVEQVEQLRDYIVQKNLRFGKIKLAGGEPTTHPDLEKIVAILRPLVTIHARRIAILTNGTRPMPDFGRRVRYEISPLPKTHHQPFLIAPVDFRITGHYGTQKKCPITRRCGVGFDAFGFSACTVAGIVGRLAGVNPYSARPIYHGMESMCRLCIFSVPPLIRQFLRQWCRDNNCYPTPTMAEALTRLATQPAAFPRWYFIPDAARRPNATQ